MDSLTPVSEVTGGNWADFELSPFLRVKSNSGPDAHAGGWNLVRSNLGRLSKTPWSDIVYWSERLGI